MTIAGNPEMDNGMTTGAYARDADMGLSGLKPAERLLIEKTLLQMYPRLQRRDLIPWRWFQGPLVPEFIVSHTDPGLRRIVEIGCGDGILSNILSLLFPDIEIIGIDTDREKIAYARSTIGYRRNVKFLCANATVLAEIPCDRIIYNRCLSQMGNVYSFKKMILKTSQWLVNEGDLLVRESPVALLSQLPRVKELWPMLREKRSIAGCLRMLLADIGYPNPMIYNSPGILGIPADIYYRSARGMILTSLLGAPPQESGADWQDWGDTTNDSLVSFLFSNSEMDLQKELV